MFILANSLISQGTSPPGCLETVAGLPRETMCSKRTVESPAHVHYSGLGCVQQKFRPRQTLVHSGSLQCRCSLFSLSSQMVCDSLVHQVYWPVFSKHLLIVWLSVCGFSQYFRAFHDYVNDLRSVISDVTVVIVSGPSKTIEDPCVLTASPAPPSSSPPQASCSLRHNNTEISQLDLCSGLLKWKVFSSF